MSLVYVACAGTTGIHRFALHTESGTLKALDVNPLPGGAGAASSNLPMAFAPGGTVLYAALRTPPYAVTSFAVDPASGGLARRGTATLPAPMAYIAVGAGGRFLLAASYKEALLSVSAIAPDGVEAL